MPLVGLLAVLRISQRVHFSLLVELNNSVYLVMLYGEVISSEWDFKGNLNGTIRGLNGAHMGQSYGVDFCITALILVW